MAAGTVLGALWRDATLAVRRRLLVAAVLTPILMVPIQRARNVRMVKHAELSARVVRLIRQHQEELAGRRDLLLVDNPQQRVNLASTFGTLIDVAAHVTAGLPNGRVRIQPDPGDSGPSSVARSALTYRLEGANLLLVQ